MRSSRDRARRGPRRQLVPYAESPEGFSAVSVLRHPWRPKCTGKRNSPASLIVLSTKHWRYRPRRGVRQICGLRGAGLTRP